MREVFRRLNSYTATLNPEELRHASFQGAFRWFIYRLTADFGYTFDAMGVFTQKQLVRMQDSKLLAEICHALLFGIQTTNRTKLDRLYRDRDDRFPEEADFDRRIRLAMSRLARMIELFGGSWHVHTNSTHCFLRSFNTNSRCPR